MAEQRYPVGIQTFREIREGGYCYVDKTRYVYELPKKYKYVFLSRPRRFGKSLLVSTFKEYFEGNKVLFSGLELSRFESEWQVSPVLAFNMGSAKKSTVQELQAAISYKLEEYEEQYQVRRGETLTDRFTTLIKAAAAQTGKRVAILIDEYDAPLLNMLHQETLSELRDTLRSFYSPIKDCDEFIRFAFVTGITKFSQLSIFSELNNLVKISMDREFSALCGITQEELETVFSDSIEVLAERSGATPAETMQTLQKQYDGYHFSENAPGVYNPFSLLSAFAKGKVESFWYDSATPAFLIDTIKRFDFYLPDMDGISVPLGDFDASSDDIQSAVPLLYQAGYLTVKGYDCEFKNYRLGFPNDEVRYGFMSSLCPVVFSESRKKGTFWVAEFVRDIQSGAVAPFMERLVSLVASIPYAAGRDKRLVMEQNVQAAVYLVFRLMGQFCQAEVHTLNGRSDCEVQTADTVYLFEFKLCATPETALAQIDAQGYCTQYRASGKHIVKIGVGFDKDTFQCSGWKVAED